MTRIIIAGIISICFLVVSCTNTTQNEKSNDDSLNNVVSSTPTSNDNADLNTEPEITEESAVEINDAPAQVCNQFKTLKAIMEKYRSATEAMSNNPDGLDYSRIANISTNIKMNIQSYERGGQSSMSPECWD